MTIKKKIRRKLFLVQHLSDLFGSDDVYEMEVRQMTNREYYFFFVSVTTAIFILSFLIKLFIA
jgi:hypothetical protein